MDSKYIKAVILCNSRFTKGIGIIATEVGRFNADVLMCKKGKLIEYEVKTSKADLNNDFNKPKHRFYATGQAGWTPHQFYFAVPTELADYAVAKVADKPYGVVVICENNTWRKASRKVDSRHKDGYVKWLDSGTNKNRFRNVKVSLFETGRHGDIYEVSYETCAHIPLKDRIKVIKRAKDLHNHNLSGKVVTQILKRMSSELANFHSKNLS